MKLLIVCDHDNKSLNVSTLSAASAAQKVPGDNTIDYFVGGSECRDVAEEAASINAANRVLLCDHNNMEHHSAENFSLVLKSVAEEYDMIIAPDGSFAKNVMPRLSALLDVQQITGVTKIIDEHTFERPIYAGNAVATVKSKDSRKVITVRMTAFDPAETGSGKAEIKNVETVQGANSSVFIKKEVSKSERPELTTASIVVSGGRGVGSAENFKLIEELADGMNAAIGASRAAVDAGYISNDYQVGQTGKVVAPDLYVAIGISGAIQHLAGMKDSKVIVAINKDEDAPIFQVADYGLVADLFEAVPEVVKALQ